MKIIVDNSNLFAGGGIQVSTSFLNDLLQINDTDEYHVIQSVNSSKQIDTDLFDDRFTFYNLSEECSTSIFVRIRKVKEIEHQVQPNVIFTVFGPSYHKSKFPKVVGFAIPHIIYPDSPFFSKLSLKEKAKNKMMVCLKSIAFKRNSNVLVFESDNANSIYSQAIREQKPTYTVSNTLNQIFRQQDKWEDIKVDKSSFDILYLTANYPHKNLEIIPKVIDTLLEFNKVPTFRFHISVTREEMGFDEKYNSYINYLGKVNINQVPLLYKQMDMLFMPSLLEVFSTSYLEAMDSNIPIVASDMGFAQDVCSDSALYAEPLNASDYALKIEKLYSDRQLYISLVEKGNINLQRFGTSMDRTRQYLSILKTHAI